MRAKRKRYERRPDTSKFGGRLEHAIEQHGPRPPGQPGAAGSRKQFHEAVKRIIPRGAGASYQTLYRILANAEEPSPQFVDAALSVLPAVRREWLVHGEGAVTHAHAAVERVTVEAARLPDETSKREDARQLQEAVLHALGIGSSGHVESWVAPLAEVLRRLEEAPVFARGRLREPFTGDLLGAALRGPLESFRIDVAQIGTEQLNDYIAAMTPVLLALAAQRRRQYEPQED